MSKQNEPVKNENLEAQVEANEVTEATESEELTAERDADYNKKIASTLEKQNPKRAKEIAKERLAQMTPEQIAALRAAKAAKAEAEKAAQQAAAEEAERLRQEELEKKQLSEEQKELIVECQHPAHMPELPPQKLFLQIH